MKNPFKILIGLYTILIGLTIPMQSEAASAYFTPVANTAALTALGAASPTIANATVAGIGPFVWGAACTPDNVNTFPATTISTSTGCWHALTVRPPASTTSASGFNIPQGTAPSSPNNGDIWTTSSGLFARIGGATQGPFTAFTGNSIVVPSGGLVVKGLVGSGNACFRPTTTNIEACYPNTDISAFNTTTPANTSSEAAFILGAYDSLGAAQKMMSLSAVWADPTAATGYACSRWNATYDGGTMDDIAIHICGNHGAWMFGSDNAAAEAPGANNFIAHSKAFTLDNFDDPTQGQDITRIFNIISQDDGVARIERADSSHVAGIELVTGPYNSVTQGWGIYMLDTGSSDLCFYNYNLSSCSVTTAYTDGGVQIGAPTGGDLGTAKLNVENGVYVGGVALASTVSPSFTTPNIGVASGTSATLSGALAVSGASITSGYGISIDSGSTTLTRGINIQTASTGADNYGIVSSLTGAATVNHAIFLSAVGGGTNYAIDVAAGAVHISGLTTGTNADFLCLSNVATIVIQSSACTISDPNLKQDIHYYGASALAAVDKLPVFTFRFKKDPKRTNADGNFYNYQLGLMATDVAKVAPLCAIYYADMKTPKSYRQECIIALLVKGMQQQDKKIVAMAKANAALSAKVNGLASIVLKLQRPVNENPTPATFRRKAS